MAQLQPVEADWSDLIKEADVAAIMETVKAAIAKNPLAPLTPEQCEAARETHFFDSGPRP
jgi:hypothetical protein